MEGVSDTQMRLHRIAVHTVLESCDPEQDPGHVNENMSQQAQKRMSARLVSTRREMGELASWEELREKGMLACSAIRSICAGRNARRRLQFPP